MHLYMRRDFELDPLWNLEPVKVLHAWSYMVKFTQVAINSTRHVLDSLNLI